MEDHMDMSQPVPEENPAESTITTSNELVDVIAYFGAISMPGYEILSDMIKAPKAKKALLVLSTFGVTHMQAFG